MTNSRCRSCRMLFASRPRVEKGVVVWSKHCSGACALRTEAVLRHGKPLTAAIAAITAKARARWSLRLGEVFGTLSERELALVRMVEVQAYQRGYSAARVPLRARRAS